jgi:hypothetical protein
MVRRRFLQKQSHAIYEAPGSRAIEQRPHRNGGLSYAHTSQLTHFFASSEQPGRFIDTQGPDRHGNARVSFAGMAASIRPSLSPSEAGAKLRMVESVLKRAPSVVSAQPRGLDDAVVETTALDIVNLHMTRDNPFPPGSRAYIAHAQAIVPPKGKRAMTQSKPQLQYETGLAKAQVSKGLLDTLKTIMNGVPSGGDQTPS